MGVKVEEDRTQNSHQEKYFEIVEKPLQGLGLKGNGRNKVRCCFCPCIMNQRSIGEHLRARHIPLGLCTRCGQFIEEALRNVHQHNCDQNKILQINVKDRNQLSGNRTNSFNPFDCSKEDERKIPEESNVLQNNNPESKLVGIVDNISTVRDEMVPDWVSESANQPHLIKGEEEDLVSLFFCNRIPKTGQSSEIVLVASSSKLLEHMLSYSRRIRLKKEELLFSGTEGQTLTGVEVVGEVKEGEVRVELRN